MLNILNNGSHAIRPGMCIAFHLLQLLFIFKVYENGKDSGEILVYINRKEIERDCGNQPSAMLEKVS